MSNGYQEAYGDEKAPRRGMPVWGWILIGCGGFAFLGIVLLAVLVGLMAPAVSRTRESSRRAVCKSNLRQIGLACHMYADDNAEKFPPDLASLQPTYVDNPRIYWCPSCGSYPGSGVSYKYLPGRDPTMPGDFVLAYDASTNNHREGGVNVLFCDAHVEWRRDQVGLEELVAAQEAVVQKVLGDPKNAAKYFEEYRKAGPGPGY